MSARDATESIQQLLASLEKISPKLEGREDDIKFLKDMLEMEEFHSVMKIHKEVSSVAASPVSPEWPSALSLLNMVSYQAEESGQSDEEKELLALLSSPHINALMSAHDQIANKEYSSAPVDVNGLTSGSVYTDEQALRVVYIEKKSDPLGATVKEKGGNIVISRVLCGGAADRSGMLHPGDVLHEINGRSLAGLNVDNVADLMRDLTGTIVFKIKPAGHDFRTRKKNELPIHMRAFFSYDPMTDRHHPCKEAGLKFERGSILRILNQEDPNWWQAVKVGEKTISTGLIPSRTLKERLACYDHHVEQLEQQKKPSKSKRRDYSTVESESFGSTMITYEEMVKVKPQAGRPRPILLVAPRGKPFDMESLRQKLLHENSTKFGIPVAHTSRSRRPDERSGKHYHFVTREEMERSIANNLFVEYAYLDGQYYGTSVNSIRNVMNSGLTCLLNLDPQAIKMVRIPELMPFVVYFRPPSANLMKQHWVPTGTVKESGIPDLIRQARYLEKTYGHYFDHAIVYKGLDSAYNDILGVANRLQKDEQWVPASWGSQLYSGTEF